jgi:hypothetical protein
VAAARHVLSKKRSGFLGCATLAFFKRLLPAGGESDADQL